MRIRPSETGDVDEYGDPVLDREDRADLDGCFTAPRMSEGIDGRSRAGVIIGLTLFMPYGTDVEYSDEIEIDGVVWQIDGEPGSWRNPKSGWEAGMTAALVRGEG